MFGLIELFELGKKWLCWSQVVVGIVADKESVLKEYENGDYSAQTKDWIGSDKC